MSSNISFGEPLQNAHKRQHNNNANPLGAISVLIVDDDKDIQDLVVSYLNLYGIDNSQILMASDPLEGLDIFRNHKDTISLVICDYYMPKSNGAELCEILKRNQPHIPIILQTGDLNIKCKDVKFVDYVLHKPYEYENLVKSIDECLSTPPIFNFDKKEERLANIDSMGISVKFLNSNKSGHGLVIDKSKSGFKVAMKPSKDIIENALVETTTTHYNFDNNTSVVDDIQKYKIVWYKVLSIDICLVGMKAV